MPKTAFGEVMRLASMICWPTFIISMMPIMSSSEVVLTMRVTRLMAAGTSRRTACGMMTWR